MSRGGGDSWRRLWETARAGVAVQAGQGSAIGESGSAREGNEVNLKSHPLVHFISR